MQNIVPKTTHLKNKNVKDRFNIFYLSKIPSDFNYQRELKFIFVIRKKVYNMMEINCTTIIIKEDNFEIPIFEKHPIMNEKVVKDYEKVLTYSGLKLHDQISHRNVKIQENEFIHQIFTKNGSHLPHLVFIHGFGGTSITGIKLFEPLFSHFQVHALDLFGIGFSSRGNYTEKFTYQQVREYYVQALQEWRKAMRIDKVYLMGHSFGGYISSLYAFKYPHRIEHLFLVSPAGTCSTVQMMQNPQISFTRKIFFCLAQKIYGCNIRPSKAMNSWILGPKIIKSVLTNRLKISENEQLDWENYFSHVNSQCDSSETGFYKLFDWPLNPKETIEEMIRKNQVPFEIDFYFGDSDWMPRDGVKRLIEQKHKGIYFTEVPSSGHQIVFDNCAFLCGEAVNKIKK